MCPNCGISSSSTNSTPHHHRRRLRCRIVRCWVRWTIERKPKLWTFYVIRKLSRFKIEWHFLLLLLLELHFVASFVADHNRQYTLAVVHVSLKSRSYNRVCERASERAQNIIGFFVGWIFVLWSNIYFMSNWLLASNTACFILLLVCLIVIVWFYYPRRTQRSREPASKIQPGRYI